MDRRNVLLGAALVALALLVAVVVTSDDHAATTIALLSVLLGWPTIVGALLLAFGVVFRTEFSQFLRTRGWSIRLPGGTEISTPQPPATSQDAENVPASSEEEIKEEVEEEITEHVPAEEDESRDKLMHGLVGAVMDQHMQARYWFFRYLQQFLVPNTKNVLTWISLLAEHDVGATRQSFEQAWSTAIPNANERHVILEVLKQNGLIKEDSAGSIIITELGKDFLRFDAGDVVGPLRRAGELPLTAQQIVAQARRAAETGGATPGN